MIYQVTHNTTYIYANAAEACHNLLRLDPRSMTQQQCLDVSIKIEPAPHKMHTYVDYFGNRVRSFEVMEPHHRLSITSRSHVVVNRPADTRPPVSPAWTKVRHSLHRDQDEATIDALQYVFDSAYVPLSQPLAEYAARSFATDRPLLDGVFDLTTRIHRDFAYDPAATTIDTSINDVFTRRRGVCQDFAHLEIGCLRSLGLAARYVSGYLRTDHTPEQTQLVGADASHAWLSVFCPNHGWIDFDPTNGCLVGDRHITIGWGRDFHDVSPIKGVVIGGAGSELSVGVEVKAMEANGTAA